MGQKSTMNRIVSMILALSCGFQLLLPSMAENGRTTGEAALGESLGKSLGSSTLGYSGPITIDAPDRKIAYGISGFDLKTGMKATDANGDDVLDLVDVTNDGGFDPFIKDDYHVTYEAGIYGADRTITVTGYTIDIEDTSFVLRQPVEVYINKEGDTTLTYPQPSLLEGITVTAEDGTDVTDQLVVVNNGGFDAYTLGEYTVEYAVVDGGQVMVQTQRKANVVIGVSPTAIGGTAVIGGGADDYLAADLFDNGSFGVFAVRNGQWGLYEYMQYWRDVAYGTKWYIRFAGSGTGTSYDTYFFNDHGNARFAEFTPNTLNGTLGTGTVTQISSREMSITWSLASGLDLTATYWIDEDSDTVPGTAIGSTKINQTWTIENNTTDAIAEGKLYMGGDVYVGDSDLSRSYYNSLTDTLYIASEYEFDGTYHKGGVVGFTGDPATPADAYWGGVFDSTASTNGSSALNAIVTNGDISSGGTGLSAEDREAYLQWHFTAGAGATVEIKAQQAWWLSGEIAVLAPTDRAVPAGATVTYVYTVFNTSDYDQTVSLSANSSQGWTATVAGNTTVTVPANSYVLVPVELEVSSTAADGDIDYLTLTASGSFAGYEKPAKAFVHTDVDSSVPYQEVKLVSQNDTTLTAAVDHTLVNANTTVDILDLNGNLMGTLTMTEAGYGSGDVTKFIFTPINGVLTYGESYYLRSHVDGIAYDSLKMFTYNQIYTVKFDLDGGTASDGTVSIADQTIAVGGTVTQPGNPTKTGYTFGGWYPNQAYLTAYDFTSSVTSSFTLYAKWNPISVTVSYDGGGADGGNPASVSTAYGSTYTIPAGVTRTGYSLVGWFDAATGGTQVTGATTMLKSTDHTLYARWTALSGINLYYDTQSNGEVTVASTTVVYGGTYPLPSISRTGYTFEGWSLTTNGTILTSADTVANANTHILYAQWTPKQVIVSYDTQTATVSNPTPVTANYGDTYTLYSLTRTGYTLTGWSLTPSGTVLSATATIANENNHTLYALWTTQSYTVSFNMGVGTAIAPQTVSYGDNISSYLTSLGTPTSSGHTFDGWYTDATYTTAYNWSTAITGNTTIYAKWTAQPPVITASDKKLSLNDAYAWMDDVDGWDYTGGPVATGNIVIKSITDEHSGSTISITSTLDTSVKGKYTVTYELTNSSGVTVQASRVIYVGEKDSSGNAYLPWFETSDAVLSLGAAYTWMTDVAAYDLDASPTNITSSVTITQAVDIYGAVYNTATALDTSSPNKYTLDYKVVDGSGNTVTATRTITVGTFDSSGVRYIPWIFAPNATVSIGSTYSLMDDIRAYDIEDGNITSNVSIIEVRNIRGQVVSENEYTTAEYGKWTVTYQVTDSDGNRITATRTIGVGLKPWIIAEDYSLAPGGSYGLLQDVEAWDVEDGDITSSLEVIKLVGLDGVEVDAGAYNTTDNNKWTVTYRATDSQGNIAEASRVIIVANKDSNGRYIPWIVAPNKVRASTETYGIRNEIEAWDIEDGNLTSSVKIVKVLSYNYEITVSQFKSKGAGSWTITYEVTDSDGNVVTVTRTITASGSSSGGSGSSGGGSSGGGSGGGGGSGSYTGGTTSGGGTAISSKTSSSSSSTTSSSKTSSSSKSSSSLVESSLPESSELLISESSILEDDTVAEEGEDDEVDINANPETGDLAPVGAFGLAAVFSAIFMVLMASMGKARKKDRECR